MLVLQAFKLSIQKFQKLDRAATCDHHLHVFRGTVDLPIEVPLQPRKSGHSVATPCGFPKEGCAKEVHCLGFLLKVMDVSHSQLSDPGHQKFWPESELDASLMSVDRLDFCQRNHQRALTFAR